jgi:Zn-dependent peptidase ImmA (M78 family)
VKRNAIRSVDASNDLLQETLAFFRVASVDAWKKGWSDHQIAFRKSGSKTDCSGKIATWVRLAELKAESIECAAFDVKKFKSAISEMRRLVDAESDIFVPALQQKCAAAGVALALVQELPGGHVSGAAKWFSSTKAMIALNLRGKALDKFWFTFFHEAGHILNDSRDQVFVDVDYADDPRELKANKFAREILIPPEHEFRLPGLRTEAAVLRFAEEIKVHPAIVVGRLQREKIVPYSWMKNLMVRLDWAVE